MLRFIARRLIMLIFLVIGLSLLVFLISNLVPNDPIASKLSQSALNNPEVVAAFREKWGLDKPLHIQYLTYLGNLLKGDLGTSIRTGNPVLQDLLVHFPATLELSIFAMIIAIIFGIIFGIISAVYRNSFSDSIIRTISISGVSIPSFWFSLLTLYVFFYKLEWLPGSGRVSPRTPTITGGTGLYLIDSILLQDMNLFSDVFAHLVLPAAVLGFFTMGLIARQTRSNLLEVMSLDYIRTARAKGLKEHAVVIKHALKNALIPVLTVAGIGFCNLLGGMVFVENIFAWPGIGQYAYLSATTRDFPAICGVSILISITYVIINLIIDILYGAIDPRVR